LAIALSTLAMAVPVFAESVQLDPVSLTPYLADHAVCDLMPETWDPLTDVEAPETLCEFHASSEFRSIVTIGHLVFAEVVSEGGTETEVYADRAGNWEPIPVVTANIYRASQGAAFDAYLSEIEDASAGDPLGRGFTFAAAPVSRSTGTWAVQGEAFEEYVLELEEASIAGTDSPGPASAPVARSSDRTWAVQGDEVYEEYMLELEDAWILGTTGAGTAAPVSRSQGRTWAVQGDAAYEEYMLELENEWAGEEFGPVISNTPSPESRHAVPDGNLEVWLGTHDLMPDEDLEAWLGVQSAGSESEVWLRETNYMPDEDLVAWLSLHE
jgi:hypothetical protein